MSVLASLTSRVGAGLVGSALALALTAPVYGADIVYERAYEYEHYRERPPVYVPPAYVPHRYGVPPAYIPQRYVYRPYGYVYPPHGAVTYPYRRYVEVAPRPPAPIYVAPRPAWSAPAPYPEFEETVPPYGWPPEPPRRW